MKAKEEIHHQLTRIEKAVRDSNHDIRNATTAISLLVTTNKALIKVKSTKVLVELLVPWHLKLKEVVVWVCEKYPGQIVFTSGYREGDGTTHSYLSLKTVDLRSTEFNDPYAVEHDINTHWRYNHPTRKLNVCLYHRTVRCAKCKNKFEVDQKIGVVASTLCPDCGADRQYLKDFGPHFHIQARDETKLIV